jgi:ABC-type oligopeptide transport system substrate-binding subunit
VSLARGVARRVRLRQADDHNVREGREEGLTMKKLVALALVAVSATAMLAAGCGGQKSSAQVGDKKLTITGPRDTSVTQGDLVEIKVSISRENFNDPVEITFDSLPEGVSLQEESRTIAKDQNSTTFNLKADAKAATVKEDVVKVSASGGGVTAGPVEFKLDVKAKGK